MNTKEPDSAYASIPRHEGEVFYGVLAKAHAFLRPKSYLEIGTATGASLELSSCPSIAIDPQFRLNVDVVGAKSACMLFQMGSDAFFAAHDPAQLFARKIDMAFLDGMHLFEFLLRDFANTEKYCERNSVIFIHDCVPTDAHVARRDAGDDRFANCSPTPSWWAGDLWRAISALIQYRPDLKIITLDAPPTGLVALTNLDPSSTVISERYFEIVEAYKSRDFTQDALDNYVKGINLTSTDVFSSFERVSQHFWLRG